MLNAVDGIQMSGENNITKDLRRLFDKTIDLSRRKDFFGAWQHGHISKERLLCILQEYVKAIIGDFDEGNVHMIGFKTIRVSRWEDFEFMKTVFPEALYVVLTRKNLTEQSRSAWYRKKADSLHALELHTKWLESWQAKHPTKSFSLHTEDLSVSRFNQMLDWLNISGCEYTYVAHANRDSSYSGQRVRMKGTCHFGNLGVSP